MKTNPFIVFKVNILSVLKMCFLDETMSGFIHKMSFFVKDYFAICLSMNTLSVFEVILISKYSYLGPLV